MMYIHWNEYIHTYIRAYILKYAHACCIISHISHNDQIQVEWKHWHEIDSGKHALHAYTLKYIYEYAHATSYLSGHTISK